MGELELLLIMGLGGLVVYSAYKAKQALPGAASSAADALQRAATNVSNVVGGALSPSLLMFSLGSGTTANGNHWAAYSGAVLTVNGIDIGLSDQIGPGGHTETAQYLLQNGWTNADIADYVVMSGVVPAQAVQEGGTTTYSGPSYITWNPNA